MKRFITAGAVALVLGACGSNATAGPPRFANTYANPGGRAWERSYREDAMREAATQDQTDCSVAYQGQRPVHGRSRSGYVLGATNRSHGRSGR
jgi:hypothetical protein